MTIATAAAGGLYHREEGDGETIILVHGSWNEHSAWQLALPEFARRMRTVVYDRRGHGRSPRHGGVLPRRRHEDDLAALIESAAGGRAHVAGTSYGASIALGLAVRRPELVLSVSAHEPPLVGVAPSDPAVLAVWSELDKVCEILDGGEIEAGARHFVEKIALGPGIWELLPEEVHTVMFRNGSAFSAELRDAHWADIDLEALAASRIPLLLTRGDASLPWFEPIVSTLAETAGHARLVTLAGAGHTPHRTHPAEYAGAVSAFASEVGGESA